MAEPTLDVTAERLVAEARRAVLTTLDARNGRPRSVPICFAASAADSGLVLYSALDEKPKARSDPRRLTRVRNLLADPRATPLTTLRLYLDMLTGGLVKEEQQRHEYLHTLRAEAERLNRQVGNVLDYSRLENRPVLRFEVVRAVSWRAASR